MKDWKHKSEWDKRGSDFMVKVSRHSVEPSAHDFDCGVNKWAVYAYIYPKHKLFSSFSVDGGMFQGAAAALPLHRGPSFFMAHRVKPEDASHVSAFQVGADYSHLHDEHYSFHDDNDPPIDVFDDADRLFEYLS